MNVKPLLNRPPIYPDESLSSYLHRIAKANLLEARHIDAMIKRLIAGQDKYNYPSKGKTYSILSGLTGLEPHRLYWASVHSLASVLVDEQRLNDEIVFDSGFSFAKIPEKFDDFHLRPISNMQYCPDCLKENPYHRKAWRVRTVAACPEHKNLLIDQCPICAKGLRESAIIETICSNCGFNLIKAPRTDLSEDSYGLKTQAVLYHWLNAGPHIPLSIPNLSANHLYHLITTLIVRIQSIRRNMNGLHPTPVLCRPIKWGNKRWQSPAHAYVAWATAFHALIDWPLGLYRTIENFFDADNRSHSEDFLFQVGSYVQALTEQWPTSKNKHINTALETYLLNKSTWFFTQKQEVLGGSKSKITPNHPMFQKFQWLLDDHAAQFLGINKPMLNVLIDREILRITPNFKYRDHKFVSCISVLFLHDSWLEVVSIEHAAWILGLEIKTAHKLSYMCVLQPCRGRDITGQLITGVTKASVDQLLEKLLSRSLATKVTAKVCMSLSHAVDTLSFWGYDEFHLLMLSLDGTLPCRYSRDSLVGDIEFLQTAIWEIAQSNAHREHIAVYQFAKQIGATRAFIQDLITRNYLPAKLINYRNVSYLPKADAEEFDKNYITLQSAKKMTKFLKNKFKTFISNRVIVPVSGPEIDGLSEYLFLRKDVEPLVPENRMSLRELASYLNVSADEVLVWVNEERIRPYSGKDSRNYIFLKDQVAAQLKMDELPLFNP